MSRFCVIGAGACGLAAVKALREHGLEVDCFEQQDDVGGNWYFGSPHANMYASASMISSKKLTEFPDFRMPRSFPHYPSHEQAFAYLRQYADHFQLTRHIQFHTTVREICSNATGTWSIAFDGEAPPRDYDGVIVASGHHTEPNLPSCAAEFSGEVLHSRDYRTPHRFDGQRVLVVGAGNSGCDLAAELGRHAEHASISLRRGYHFLPKFLNGAPLDRCGETMAKYRLPWFVYRAITSAFLRIAVGPLDRYGLPTPSDRLFESHPIVNSQLLQEIAHGRVRVMPQIASIDGKMVTFTDGTETEFDVLLCATGYRLSWPFLAAEEAKIEPSGLHLRVFPAEFNGLFFAGLIQPNGGIWPLADLQARLIAKFLLAKQRDDAGDASGTFQAIKRQIEATDIRMISGGLKYNSSPRHAIEVEYFSYRRTIQRLLRHCQRLGLLTSRQISGGGSQTEAKGAAR